MPSPSSSAVYKIFRSCLNELIRTGLLSVRDSGDKDVATDNPRSSPQPQPKQISQASSPSRKRRRVTRNLSPPPTEEAESYAHVHLNSSPLKEPAIDELYAVPTLPATLMSQCQDASSPGQRIWKLAQKCQGICLSGRTLRRLPVLGLAMYTWGGEVGIDEAIGALEKAVEEEVVAIHDNA